MADAPGNTKVDSLTGTVLWNRTLAQEVDRLASEVYGIHPQVLMETAGRGVADHALALGAEERPVLILAGPGNNGGDALVAARLLLDAGCDVRAVLVAEGDPPKFTPSCQAQAKTLMSLDIRIGRYAPGGLKARAGAEPLIIDGLIGLGFKGPLNPESLAAKALVEASAIEGSVVLAIDLPSGLDPDRGDQPAPLLPADLTVTFGGLKPVHAMAPARDSCGQVTALDIGFPLAAVRKALETIAPPFVLAETPDLLAMDPWRSLSPSAHKYDRGHVLVIGGSAGKTGAPIMCGLAALRGGAGWATLSMPHDALESFVGEMPPELVFEDLFDDEGTLSADRLSSFVEERKVRAIAIGPGTMENPLTGEVVTVLSDFVGRGGFCVLDAGAVKGTLPMLDGLVMDPDRVLLTPHPGEWATLASPKVPAPLSPDAVATVRDSAMKAGATLMYKHATPVVVTGDPDAPAFVSEAGSNILARAGSGDILCGLAAAHGARGMPAVPAALRSQAVLGTAAEIAAARVGEDAVCASDILKDIGRVQIHEHDESSEDEDVDHGH